MILLFSLRGIAFSAASSIKANEQMAIVLYIIPLGAIAWSGWHLWHNRLVGIPPSLQPALDRASLAMEERIAGMQARYVAFRRRLSGVGA